MGDVPILPLSRLVDLTHESEEILSYFYFLLCVLECLFFKEYFCLRELAKDLLNNG